MLAAAGVSKAHGAQVVLANVDLVVPPDARIGLVGPNGVGQVHAAAASRRSRRAGPRNDRPAARPRRRATCRRSATRCRARRCARISRGGRASRRRSGGWTRSPRGSRTSREFAQAYPDALDAFLARGGGDLDARRQHGLAERRARRDARPAARPRCPAARPRGPRSPRPPQPLRRPAARRADERSRLRRVSRGSSRSCAASTVRPSSSRTTARSSTAR